MNKFLVTEFNRVVELLLFVVVPAVKAPCILFCGHLITSSICLHTFTFRKISKFG